MAATEIQGEAHCACTLCQVSSAGKLPTFHSTIALQCCKLNSIPKSEAETSPKGTETLYHKSRVVREHAVRERPLYVLLHALKPLSRFQYAQTFHCLRALEPQGVASIIPIYRVETITPALRTVKLCEIQIHAIMCTIADAALCNRDLRSIKEDAILKPKDDI